LKVWQLDSRVLLQGDEKGEAGVIFDSQSATFCRCNDAAWLLLFRLQNGATMDDLVSALTAEFEVDEETANEDIVTLLHSLMRMELVSATQ